jgi:tetratricopeptide (TPR) repeat protein
MRATLLVPWICVAVLTASAAARPQPPAPSSPRSSSWRQIVGSDLVVAGNAPTAELKRIFAEVTRFRNALALLFPDARVTSPVPTSVVVFRDQATFRRFAPRDSRGRPMVNVGGYFSRQPDANFIVMPSAGRGEYSLQTIFHEYTHYVVSRNVRGPIPGWLNEGLAEFYSTFRGDFRGRTLIGSAPPSRVRAIRDSTWVPLRDIVSPRDLQAMWRWDRQIALYYAESWALVHYIIVDRTHPVANPIATYLTSFRRTGNHDSAFMEAFGVDVGGMDKELREYVRRHTFPAILFDVQAVRDVPDEALAMLEADVDALEGRLLLQVGDHAEAERELAAVAQRYPAHAAAQISLARLRLAQDREDDAITALQDLVAASPEDAGARYYLGTALNRAWRHDEALAEFSTAIGLMPGNPAPWSGLSFAALALRRDAQAAAAVETALSVEWSPSYYYTMGLEALRLGRDDVATASIATYLELRGVGEDLSVYPLFIQAVAARRAGLSADADAALALAESARLPQEWTRTVLRYLQGRLDEGRFLRAARDIGQQTEARTYIGFALALAGREDDAVAHFRWVADRGAKNYVEYELARNELNRIKYRDRVLPVP